jgi:hypothetical protein
VSPFEAKRNADLDANSSQIPHKNAQDAFVSNQSRIPLLDGASFANIGFPAAAIIFSIFSLILTGTKIPWRRSRLALPPADQTRKFEPVLSHVDFDGHSGIGFNVFVPFHSSESE